MITTAAVHNNQSSYYATTIFRVHFSASTLFRVQFSKCVICAHKYGLPLQALANDAISAYHDSPVVLPPPRPTDYIFQLSAPLSSLPARPPIKLDMRSQEFMKQEIKRLLDLGFIRKIQPVNYNAVPFVTWAGKKPRMVIDYRPLNSITVPVPSSLVPFHQVVANINGSIMSTLDLSQAYHHLRLHTATEEYTAFRVGHEYYCWRVLAFGLSASGEKFCQFVASLFSDLPYVRFFLDDAIITSDSPEQHVQHVKTVLQRLTHHHLHLNVEKSKFFKTTVDWVGHTLTATPDGKITIAPQDSTIDTIRNFPRPICKKDVQAFLGHLAYISEFIDKFADITAPLTDLLAKNVRFSWTDECQQAFSTLVNIEANQCQLHPFDSSLPIKLTTDASKVAVGAVLWQLHDTVWFPVEYRSRKLKDAQLNWSTLEKELFAIRFGVERFRYYIAHRPKIIVQTDHKPIMYLFTSTDLTPKLSRWLADLVPYNLEVQHIPGVTNGPADWLSRLPAELSSFSITTSPSGPWLTSIVANYSSDELLSSIYADPSSSSNFSIDAETGLLYKNHNLLCVPHDNIQGLLDAVHSSPVGGHLGITRTIAYLTRYFFFPRLRSIVTNYINSCDVCQRVKSATDTTGHLQEVPIPTGRWTEIAVDVVSGFETAELDGRKVDSALVMVDLFSCRVHLHPISKTFNHRDFANILINHHFPLHGIPAIIHSDRGTQFTHKAMEAFLHNIGTASNLSVTAHHQSNGKAERYIRTLQDYLRCYVEKQSDWVKLLPIAEFVINASPAVSLGGSSPFEVDIGYIPSSPAALTFCLLEEGREADDLTEILDRQTRAAKAALNQAHAKARNQFNLRHRHVELKAGDMVFIDYKAIPIGDVHNLRLPASLRTKFVGPFEVETKMSAVNYKLVLPKSYKRSPIFHISQLRRKKELPAGYFAAPDAPSAGFRVYKDGSTDVEITKIVKHRKKTKGYSVKVMFVDKTISDWKPLSEIRKTAAEIVESYAKEHHLDW
ncbi:unnamed protein product [Ambrosiozyma monospora]|uniref:Unnamed protein product n=1 Tax=Ambrosiozyma monospora TaxID=43982 RepID=A0A9W6Z3C6_AMBMO|nr:unnamed protein product [Ambrosiozyma monospora]